MDPKQALSIKSIEDRIASKASPERLSPTRPAHEPSTLSQTRPPSYHDGYTANNGIVVQYQHEWAKHHKLEGDGLLTQLFDHLWKSDRAKEHRLKTVCIPDTVVFEHNFPRAWYFYDAKAQEIVKRPGKFLDAHSIFASFSEQTSTCDIVCQYYYKKPQTDQSQRQPRRPRTGKRDPREPDDAQVAVEFFTKESLFTFLHSRPHKPDGILQRFVVPKGKPSQRRNFQIQAVWSPVVTLVYKRTTSKLLNDRGATLEERAATFDGPPHFSQESLVAMSTQERIDSLCRDIVEHFSKTEPTQMVRVVLYFKEDDNDVLWLLWASSMRVSGDKLNPVNVRVPVELSLNVAAAEEEEQAGASVIRSSQRQVDLELLHRDAQLYAMTGDVAFVRKCSGRQPSPARPSPRSTTHASRRDSKSTLVPPSSDNRTNAVPAPPQTSRPRAAPTVRPKSNFVYRDSPPKRPPPTQISPRAPFFPTSHPNAVVSVESSRHPLHRKLLELSPRSSDRSYGGGHGYSPGRTVGGNVNGNHAPTDGTENVARRELPRDQQAACKDLTTLAADSIYESYCIALRSQQSSSSAPTGAVELTIDDAFSAVLDDVDFQRLLQLLKLTDDSEGHYRLSESNAVVRGMRRDRPVAQLFKDVEKFVADLFQEKGEDITDRYRRYCESNQRVDARATTAAV